MSFLRSLDLSRNQLATLHDGENLLCLHTLIMDDNKLEELPPCIGQLQALRVLSIRNNSILTFTEGVGLGLVAGMLEGLGTTR